MGRESSTEPTASPLTCETENGTGYRPATNLPERPPKYQYTGLCKTASQR